ITRGSGEPLHAERGAERGGAERGHSTLVFCRGAGKADVADAQRAGLAWAARCRAWAFPPGCCYNTRDLGLSPDVRWAELTPQPRYSKADHAQRGTALYEQSVRPQVEAGNHGKIVALDIDSGACEVAEDTLTAAQRLLARHPGAQIWCVRIGYPAVHR